MEHATTWVVIADGAKARLFKNEGPGKGLEDLAEGNHPAARLKNGEINSDAPGRTLDAAGEGRHFKEPEEEPQAREKRKFLSRLAKVLHTHADNFERLVLILPPQALGELRAALSKAVSPKVTAEMDKDLTNLSTKELPEHLGKVMAL